MAPALTVPPAVGRAGAVRPGRPRRLVPAEGQHGLAAIAKRICGHCPVRAQGLDYALSGADTWGRIATGIWGGATPQERDRLLQERKAVAA